jgi:ribosomal protein S1
MFLTPVVNLFQTIVNKTAASETESAINSWEGLAYACDKEIIVTGYLAHKVESGYMVRFGDILGFCPRYRFDLCEYDSIPEIFLNKPLKFYVLSVDEENEHLVISRIDVIKDTYADYFDGLSKGEVVQGEVSSISDRLVTLDLGGVTCIVSQNEVSWTPINHPADILSIGDNVRAKLLKVVPSKAYVTASLKQLDDKHWQDFNKTNSVGDEVKVTINSIADFGYFVLCENHIAGMLHWSELSWKARSRQQVMVYERGDELSVKISDIDTVKQQVSFSLKAMTPNPAETVLKEYEVGDVVTGVIRSRTDFGLFVEISDGFNGLLHFSNLSWFTNSKNNLVNFRAGLSITCKIIDIDNSTGRIGLGLKQLCENPFAVQPSVHSLVKAAEFPRTVRVGVSSFFQANCHNQIVALLNEVQQKMRQHISLEIDNIFFDDEDVIVPDILVVLLSDDYLASDTYSALETFLLENEGLAPMIIPITADEMSEGVTDPFAALAGLPVDRNPLHQWRVKSAFWATVNKALVKSIRYAAGLK